MRLAGKEFSLPGMPAGNQQGTSRERAGNGAGAPARPAARRTDCPCSSGRRHVATLAQIIRVNLDAKMAGFHRRKGRFQTSSHDWITASKAGVHLFRRTSLSSLVSHAIAREVRGARVMGPCLSHGSSPWAAGLRDDKDSSPINSDPDSGTKQAVKLQPLIEPPPVTLLLL